VTSQHQRRLPVDIAVLHHGLGGRVGEKHTHDLEAAVETRLDQGDELPFIVDDGVRPPLQQQPHLQSSPSSSVIIIIINNNIIITATATTSRLTTARQSWKLARCRAVLPLSACRFMAAPSSSSQRTTPTWPSAAAWIKWRHAAVIPGVEQSRIL
jgi:hypothetical protein